MKASHIFLGVLVAVIWGFNFVVVEIGLDSFPPLFFSALRFLCAAFPAVLFVRRDGLGWRWILSIGFTLGVVMFSLVFLGMDLGLPAGLSSVVLQIQVVFTLLLSGILLHDSPSTWQKIGVAVALGGIGLLAAGMHGAATFPGLVLVVAAGFVWGISNILLKLSRSVNMFRLIIWMSIVPPLPLLLISLIFEEGQADALARVSWTGVGAILYTGLISTVVGFGLWAKLFKEYSPNTIAPFALLVPVSGIVSSALVLGERFTLIELLSLCIVFAGLFMVVMEARLSSVLTPKWNRIGKRLA